MRIAIKFGDNDFYNCFSGVLLTMLEAYKWTGEHLESKEEIVSVVNEISYGCYVLFQKLRHGSEDLNEKSRIKEYLQITKERVLIDEEIDQYIEEFSWQLNGELFILDTRLDYEGNSPVYPM